MSVLISWSFYHVWTIGLSSSFLLFHLDLFLSQVCILGQLFHLFNFFFIWTDIFELWFLFGQPSSSFIMFFIWTDIFVYVVFFVWTDIFVYVVFFVWTDIIVCVKIFVWTDWSMFRSCTFGLSSSSCFMPKLHAKNVLTDIWRLCVHLIEPVSNICAVPVFTISDLYFYNHVQMLSSCLMPRLAVHGMSYAWDGRYPWRAVQYMVWAECGWPVPGMVMHENMHCLKQFKYERL